MPTIKVVAIERQYCSGGSSIGKRAAELLGVPCYDSEIVDLAAEKLGITPDEVRKFEEAILNPLRSRLSLRIGQEKELDMFEKVFAAEAEIITAIAKKEPCIIVGRCAGYILKSVTRTLKVYISAAAESRVARAVSKYGIAFEDADSKLRRYDKKRAEFFNANTRMNWSSMLTYDLCLNSSTLGEEACARIIADTVRASAEKPAANGAAK